MEAKPTKFGTYFRVLRVRHNEVLADAKEFLNCSSAFISAVENGHKTVPSDWYEKIVEHYKLGGKDQKKLFNLIEESKKSIHIDIATSSQLHRNLAIQFQRSFDGMDEKTANDILNILKNK